MGVMTANTGVKRRHQEASHDVWGHRQNCMQSRSAAGVSFTSQ